MFRIPCGFLSLFSVSSYTPIPGLLFSLIKSLKAIADTQDGSSSLVETHRKDTLLLCCQGLYFVHPAQATGPGSCPLPPPPCCSPFSGLPFALGHMSLCWASTRSVKGWLQCGQCFVWLPQWDSWTSRLLSCTASSQNLHLAGCCWLSLVCGKMEDIGPTS